MTLYEFILLGGVLLSGCVLGALVAYAVLSKREYHETGLLKVGWCVIDDDDAVLGFAKAPEDYAAIMQGKDYATAHPMYIKLED